MVTIRPEEGNDHPQHDDHIDDQGKGDQQHTHDTESTRPAHGDFPLLLMKPWLDSCLLSSLRYSKSEDFATFLEHKQTTSPLAPTARATAREDHVKTSDDMTAHTNSDLVRCIGMLSSGSS